MYDIIIVGAGPAGLSAAYYALCNGRKTVIFEAGQVGGTISHVSAITHFAGAPQWMPGADFAKALEDDATAAGADIRHEAVRAIEMTASGVRRVVTDAGVYESKCIVLAHGGTPRAAGYDGEDAFAGRFARLNAPRDAARFAEREVYVIGGANGAAKEAIFLAKTAPRVTIVCVEPALACSSQFRGIIEATDAIVVRPASKIVAVRGEGELSEIDIESLADGSVETVSCPGAGVFSYAGATPNTGMLDGAIELDAAGYIVTDEAMRTSVDGVFAAGDIRSKKVRQVATAVGDGAIAGMSASAYCSR